jgi:hypothetical protein
MRSEWISILVTVKKQANGYILKTMKLDKKVWGFETFEAARNLETVQLKKNEFPEEIEHHNLFEGMLLWPRGNYRKTSKNF